MKVRAPDLHKSDLFVRADISTAEGTEKVVRHILIDRRLWTPLRMFRMARGCSRDKRGNVLDMKPALQLRDPSSSEVRKFLTPSNPSDAASCAVSLTTPRLFAQVALVKLDQL